MQYCSIFSSSCKVVCLDELLTVSEVVVRDLGDVDEEKDDCERVSVRSSTSLIFFSHFLLSSNFSFFLLLAFSVLTYLQTTRIRRNIFKIITAMTDNKMMSRNDKLDEYLASLTSGMPSLVSLYVFVEFSVLSFPLDMLTDLYVIWRLISGSCVCLLFVLIPFGIIVDVVVVVKITVDAALITGSSRNNN